MTSLPVRSFHFSPAIRDAEKTIAGGEVQGRGIGGVVVERCQEGMIVADVFPRSSKPFGGLRSEEKAAWRQFCADHVFLGRGHTGIKRVLRGGWKWKESQEKEESHYARISRMTSP